MSCRDGQHEEHTAEELSELLRGKVVLRLRQDDLMRLIVQFTDNSKLVISPSKVDVQRRGGQSAPDEIRDEDRPGGPRCPIPPTMIF